MSIYLDNSASTPVRNEVLEAMQPFLSDKWGNPSSVHKMGREARGAIEVARRQIARLIGSQPANIRFTPGGTYSNNITLLGRARFAEENNLGRHLVTTCIEHSSGLGPSKYLESRGWKVDYINTDGEGFIDLDALRAAITPQTSMVSLMLANNEIGTVQPIEQFVAIAKKHGVFFHTDAVQAGGKIPIDVSKLLVDSMSLSGHKFHGPKGIGVLYLRDPSQISPILFGGGHESGFFPGTENLASIVGIGKAAEIAADHLEENAKRLRRIQEILIEKLLAHECTKLTGPKDLNRRIPGHVSVIVAGTVGEELVYDADFKGICISSVSACSSAGHDPSHVLSCIGVPREEVMGSARITAGCLNTIEECTKAADILAELFAKRSAKRKLASAAK